MGYLGIFITAVTAYSLGYAVASARRARSDYQRTKAGLPGMRKAMWSLLWSAAMAAVIAVAATGFSAYVTGLAERPGTARSQ